MNTHIPEVEELRSHVAIGEMTAVNVVPFFKAVEIIERLKARHQADIEKARQEERREMVEHFSQYLREWQDGMEYNSPTVKVSWVIEQIQALTKTDKQTEV